jgi:ATP-dependent Zn protease
MTKQSSSSVDEQKQKEATAFHEAGHATVARHGTGTLASVGIVKGQKEWKGATVASYDKGDADGKAEYFAAGAIAQERGAPGSSKLFQDQSDVNNLNSLADTQAGDPNLLGPFALPQDRKLREAFKDKARQAAKKIIDDHWDEVEKITQSLLAKESLTAQEVDELLK